MAGVGATLRYPPDEYPAVAPEYVVRPSGVTQSLDEFFVVPIEIEGSLAIPIKESPPPPRHFPKM